MVQLRPREGNYSYNVPVLRDGREKKEAREGEKEREKRKRRREQVVWGGDQDWVEKQVGVGKTGR